MERKAYTYHAEMFSTIAFTSLVVMSRLVQLHTRNTSFFWSIFTVSKPYNNDTKLVQFILIKS